MVKEDSILFQLIKNKVYWDNSVTESRMELSCQRPGLAQWKLALTLQSAVLCASSPACISNHGNEKSPSNRGSTAFGPTHKQRLVHFRFDKPYEMSSKMWLSVKKSHESTTKYHQKGAKDRRLRTCEKRNRLWSVKTTGEALSLASV